MNRSSPWIVILGLLTLGYILQLNSPLRTNTDATCFMQMGASASDGLGYTCCKNAQHYPIGYPALLSALDRAGIACSATIIAVNLLSLSVGLIVAARLLRQSFEWTQPALIAGTAITLLNWSMIKHITLPLTDIPYLGISMLCLLFLTIAAGKEYPYKLASLSIGLILLVLSITVRTVGIALIPAFAFAAISGSILTWLSNGFLKHKSFTIGFASAICVAALAGFLVISRTNYFREMLENWVSLTDLAVMRLDDWGELVINTSMAKVPTWLRCIQLLAGLLCALLIATGFAKRRRIQVIDVYLAGYLAILFVWPYRDARFWIPVFPLMLGYAGLAIQPMLASNRYRWIPPAYLAAYSMLGLVALAYSSWLSYSGDKFGDRFAGGVYRDSYRTAFRTGPVPTLGESKIDPQIVRLLERYRLDRPTPAESRVASSVR